MNSNGFCLSYLLDQQLDFFLFPPWLCKIVSIHIISQILLRKIHNKPEKQFLSLQILGIIFRSVPSVFSMYLQSTIHNSNQKIGFFPLQLRKREGNSSYFMKQISRVNYNERYQKKNNILLRILKRGHNLIHLYFHTQLSTVFGEKIDCHRLDREHLEYLTYTCF